MAGVDITSSSSSTLWKWDHPQPWLAQRPCRFHFLLLLWRFKADSTRLVDVYLDFLWKHSHGTTWTAYQGAITGDYGTSDCKSVFARSPE